MLSGDAFEQMKQIITHKNISFMSKSVVISTLRTVLDFDVQSVLFSYQFYLEKNEQNVY